MSTHIRKAVQNIVGKEKMSVICMFSFSHNVFYLSQKRFQSSNHMQFVVCKCFQFRPVKNFVIESDGKPAFSTFPTMFSKGFFLWFVDNWHYVLKVYCAFPNNLEKEGFSRVP